jgi:hypothetical protein
MPIEFMAAKEAGMNRLKAGAPRCALCDTPPEAPAEGRCFALFRALQFRVLAMPGQIRPRGLTRRIHPYSPTMRS